jgi:hypothetical protein
MADEASLRKRLGNAPGLLRAGRKSSHATADMLGSGVKTDYQVISLNIRGKNL